MSGKKRGRSSLSHTNKVDQDDQYNHHPRHHQDMELRRGPWTLEEDTLLIHYIACHGEGRWNLLARCSGLKRTGKSCRLRWLNYLKPDIKRGNLSPEEQLLILELHSKWGNRWSRIAQYLPGRTDNEIKNYWRTRVQKQARQLKIDANSASFRDAIRCYWMPRMLEKTSNIPQSVQLTNNSMAAAPAPAAIDLLQPLHDQDPPHDHLSYFQPIILQRHADQITASSGLNGSSTLQVPNLPEFSSSCSMDDIHGGGIDFNPFLIENINAFGSGAWVNPDPMAASALVASNINPASDYTDGLWSMDQLYGMLKSYMDMDVEYSMFPFSTDSASTELM
ncbi:hypothetical protein Cni_G27273 [Canna indica]|uniref:Uncharacterized protein n=1 Tax=Canna indica TaxID=4628 RepID=A0AAQ3L0I5_9LILI|nr:hypothetical protein Cni_G27273 [Canna indica]